MRTLSPRRLAVPAVACAVTVAVAGCGGAAKPAGPAVPNVVGKNLPDAVVDVLGVHLCPHVAQGPPEPWGSRTEPVVAQAPGAGTRLRRWATVTITARVPQPPGFSATHSSHSFDVFWGGHGKIPCPPIGP